MKQDFEPTEESKNTSQSGGNDFEVASDIEELKPKNRILLWLILILALAAILIGIFVLGKKKEPVPAVEKPEPSVLQEIGETEQPVEDATVTPPEAERKAEKVEKPQTQTPPAEKPISPIPRDRAGIINWFKQNRIPVYGGIELKNIPESLENDINRIKDGINSRKINITNLYRQSSAVQPSAGTITIKLYILDNGRVGAAEVIPGSDSFAQKFITDVRDLVEKWSFGTTNLLVYQFSFRLS